MPTSLRHWAAHPAQFLWLSLAFGVSLAVAVATMSVVNAVFLRSLPVDKPDELFVVNAVVQDNASDGSVFAMEFEAWRQHQNAFKDIAAYQHEWPTDVLLEGRVHRVASARVTVGMFPVLGATPRLGRFFAAEEDNASVVVLSHSAWVRLFNASPNIVGTPLRVKIQGVATQVAEVIGVAPEGLDFTRHANSHPDLIFPITDGHPGAEFGARAMNSRYVIGRLQTGFSEEAASEQMSATVRRVAGIVPSRPERIAANLVPLHESLFGDNRRMAWVFGLVGTIVLLVAYSNALALLFSVYARRARATALRVSLGATPHRLLREALAETSWLILGAMVFALLAGLLLTQFGIGANAVDIKGLSAARVGPSELVLGFGASALMLFGAAMVPVFMSRTRLLSALLGTEGANTSSKPALRTRRLLLAVQMALVTVLLIAASLSLVSLRSLLNQPLGFEPSGVLVAEMTPSTARIRSVEARAALLFELNTLLRDWAGDAPFAIAQAAPLGARLRQRAELAGRPIALGTTRATEGYLKALGAVLVAGSDLGRSAGVDRPAVVNEAFVHRFFKSAASALGQQFTLGTDRTRPYHIVGVVANIRQGALSEPVDPGAYLLLTPEDSTMSTWTVVARANGNADELSKRLNSLDAEMYVTSLSLKAKLAQHTALATLQAVLLTGLGSLVLFFACAGSFALVYQLAIDSRRELAIKSALGASSGRLLRDLAQAVFTPAGTGLMTGLAATYIFVPLLKPFLFETDVYSWVIWLSTLVVLTAMVLGAAVLPARRLVGAPLLPALGRT